MAETWTEQGRMPPLRSLAFTRLMYEDFLAMERWWAGERWAVWEESLLPAGMAEIRTESLVQTRGGGGLTEAPAGA